MQKLIDFSIKKKMRQIKEFEAHTSPSMFNYFSMPKMNGLERANAVKKEFPSLPVLMTTGYAELPPGIDMDLPWIGKPHRQDELRAQIARSVQRVS